MQHNFGTSFASGTPICCLKCWLSRQRTMFWSGASVSESLRLPFTDRHSQELISVSDCSRFFLANVEQHKINDIANPTVWRAATFWSCNNIKNWQQIKSPGQIQRQLRGSLLPPAANLVMTAKGLHRGPLEITSYCYLELEMFCSVITWNGTWLVGRGKGSGQHQIMCKRSHVPEKTQIVLLWLNTPSTESLQRLPKPSTQSKH